MKSSPFQIINAAAGSGKTYSLVYSYLKKLFSSYDLGEYRKMLALTFTNKAAFEMKSRILNSLYMIAYNINSDEIKNYNASLIIDLKTDEITLKKKIKKNFKKNSSRIYSV